MDFKEWAEEYFGKNVDVPEACRDAWNAAMLEEREACAKVCDEGAAALNTMGERDGANGAMSCAGAIRMRSNVELTGAAWLYRAASSDRRERG